MNAATDTTRTANVTMPAIAHLARDPRGGRARVIT